MAPRNRHGKSQVSSGEGLSSTGLRQHFFEVHAHGTVEDKQVPFPDEHGPGSGTQAVEHRAQPVAALGPARFRPQSSHRLLDVQLAAAYGNKF